MGIWPAIQRFAERNSPTRKTWSSITARAFSSSCLDAVVLQRNSVAANSSCSSVELALEMPIRALVSRIFKGSYLNVGQEARDFTINPFSLPQTKENLQFLFSFFRVLIEGNEQRFRIDFKEERRLWDAIERIYVL